MAAKPYTWEAWWKARSRMPEIWNGWSSYLDHHADKAMVNSLRRGTVPFRGEATALGTPFLVSLKDVVAGLLSLNFPLAEYETTELGTVVTLGGYAERPISSKKIAVLSNPELAWEEFRDDLIRFELRAGAIPNSDPAEATAQQGRRRAIGTTSQAPSSNRHSWLAYKRRVAGFRKRGRTPPIQTTKDGEKGDREWAVANGVSRDIIKKWRLELLGTQARGRPRNSAGK
jgi:hypothetical protein